MRLAFFIFVLFVPVLTVAAAYPPAVVWDSPSAGPQGSMPLGNGDIGLNAWVEADGDLLFYIAKTDAWSENARLLKLGRLRVSIAPNPFRAGLPFKQTLDTAAGVMRVVAGPPSQEVSIELWVDANYPAVRFRAVGAEPAEIRVTVESWRTERRELHAVELHSAYGLADAGVPVVVEPDSFLDFDGNEVIWHHRNKRSLYEEVMRKQDVEQGVDPGRDPLLNLTFGGLVRGQGLRRMDVRTLVGEPAKTQHFVVYCHTAQSDTETAWTAQLRQRAKEDIQDYGEQYAAHVAWWHEFWERSWIRLGGKAPEAVERGYALQRYISACAGRGAYPIKFNGSLFTVDAVVDDMHVDADYRLWGGPYWFQNTRLVYWPMLASGDHEMMQPLFRMYHEALPFAQARTKLYFGHSGAFFPETMYFWGAYNIDNYGWDRPAGLAKGITENRYIRYHYDGILELAILALAYHGYTGDERFLRQIALPMSHAFLTFYFEHYPRESDGLLRITPSQALETWWDAANPAPPIAGLTRVLNDLIALPSGLLPDETRKQYEKWRTLLPPLPKEMRDGVLLLAPAAELPEQSSNSENPELYAIFPYRLFGVGKDDLALARNSFEKRRFKGNIGWRQDETQAAILGLTETAAKMVADRASRKHPESRFPAFWGPNFDWIPDQDHGGNLLMALQTMLLFADDEVIHLFAAWPRDWEVDFKLHAPNKTTVHAIYRDGDIVSLEVFPPERRQDVRLHLE